MLLWLELFVFEGLIRGLFGLLGAILHVFVFINFYVVKVYQLAFIIFDE